MRPSLADSILLASLIINTYLLGAAALLGVVAYPALGDISGQALSAAHAALSKRLGLVFILPEFLAFLVVLPLFRFRPANVPDWSVATSVAVGVLYFVITFAWHLPAHKVLAFGDASAMSILLSSHWARVTTIALKCGILAWMLGKTLG